MQEQIPSILILSHGQMCHGLKDSASMLTGDTENVVCLSLEIGQDPDDYFEKVKKAYKEMPAGSIIFVDIFGGTPSNTVARLAKEKEAFAIAGVNLAMLLCAICFKQTLCGEELIAKIEEEAGCSVINIHAMFKEMGMWN